jgi:hypothetical protein
MTPTNGLPQRRAEHADRLRRLADWLCADAAADTDDAGALDFFDAGALDFFRLADALDRAATDARTMARIYGGQLP